MSRGWHWVINFPRNLYVFLHPFTHPSIPGGNSEWEATPMCVNKNVVVHCTENTISLVLERDTNHSVVVFFYLYRKAIRQWTGPRQVNGTMDRWWFRAVSESERRQIGHSQEFASSSRTWRTKYIPGSTLSCVKVFKALLCSIDYNIIRMERRDSRVYILGLPFDLSTLIHHQKSLYWSDGGITSANALKLSVYWLRYTTCTHAYLYPLR